MNQELTNREKCLRMWQIIADAAANGVLLTKKEVIRQHPELRTQNNLNCAACDETAKRNGGSWDCDGCPLFDNDTHCKRYPSPYAYWYEALFHTNKVTTETLPWCHRANKYRIAWASSQMVDLIKVSWKD